jgi:eukaryotic-like serine/threonine-protein kinase
MGVNPSMAVSIGGRFDRYEIIAPLGSGGMGEVYLARDSRLGRKIALKVLLTEFTKDPSRLQRFEQEAKTASALNHPNIITIHEIGEFNSTHFITTEFIEGRTLRQIISKGKVSSLLAVEIAIQITSALAAAHEAGIIHRDIKPENLMVRPDGIVKVLDFGLAKLTERHYNVSEPDAPTLARLDTDPGTVMGTANYMSPEQARGLRVDARTDIFSFGVVLYEMVASRPPFGGETAADVISDLLKRDPLPLTSFVSAVPAELQRIITKALRKDREERYQTTKDLLVDLKSLRRELETNATMDLASAPVANSGEKNVTYATTVFPSTDPAESLPTEPIYPRATSSAEYIVTQIRRHKRGVALTLVALAAVLVGVLAFTDRDHTIESIAVLPFINQNTDDNARLLSDAITDSIINNLSRLSNLNVKPRNAVQRFSNREVELKDVAKELSVHAVLTGRVVQHGDELSVSVALVDTHDNRHLWGEVYKRKIADLLLIQQEISRAVSNELSLKLSGDEKLRLEAHQLYLKGRNAWSKRTAESLQEGIKYFEDATRTDPSYAPAYAGLADCYNMLVNYSVLPSKEAFPKARRAAEKALELDQDLAEAHAALAFINHQWEWDWIEAEREFKLAIDSKPNYAPAHQWYSSLLAGTGRTEEAIAEAKRAQELEPFSLIVSSHLGWINYLARRYDQAIEQAQQKLKLDPNFFPAHRYQALAHQAQGKHDLAIAGFQKALSLSRGSPLLKAELAHAYAIAGRRKEAQAALDELQQLSVSRHFSPSHLALIYTGLGENDRAIELLNKAFNERAERLVWLKVDPRFDRLHSDARFIDLLQRIGLVM